MDNGKIPGHLKGARTYKNEKNEFLRDITYEKTIVPSSYKGRSRRRLMRCGWMIRYKGEHVVTVETLKEVDEFIKEKLDG